MGKCTEMAIPSEGSRKETVEKFMSMLGTCSTIRDAAPSRIIAGEETGESSQDNQAKSMLELLKQDNTAGQSRSGASEEDQLSSFPSFSILTNRSSSSRSFAGSQVQDSSTAEDVATRCLASATRCPLSDIPIVPGRIARSIASSYASLISANLSQLVRKLLIERSDLRPIRIAKVTTSFETVKSESSPPADSSPMIANHFLMSIDFEVMITDNGIATFSASGSGVATCRFAPMGSSLIDKADVVINASELLHSLRKQARVAALFALMAAAAANGGSIGGAGGGQVANRPRELRLGARCVSPEPREPPSHLGKRPTEANTKNSGKRAKPGHSSTI